MFTETGLRYCFQERGGRRMSLQLNCPDIYEEAGHGSEASLPRSHSALTRQTQEQGRVWVVSPLLHL